MESKISKVVASFLFVALLSTAYLCNLIYRVFVLGLSTYSFDFGLLFIAFGFFHFGCQLLLAKWIYTFRGNPEALKKENDD